MPFIEIQTNRTATDAVWTQLLTAVTTAVHEIKGDPIAAISAVAQPANVASFGGDAAAPCAIVQMTATRFTDVVTASLTRRFTTILGDAFGVAPARIYVFFRDIPAEERHLVGWNGKTFKELFPTV